MKVRDQCCLKELITFLFASLLLSLQDFLLERVWLGEVDADLVSGDLVVDLSDSVDLVLNLLLVEGV